MRRYLEKRRLWRVGVVLVLALAFSAAVTSAQDNGGIGDEEFGTATYKGGPERGTLVRSSKPPVMTAERKAQLEKWQSRVNLPGPKRDGVQVTPAAPAAGSEAKIAAGPTARMSLADLNSARAGTSAMPSPLTGLPTVFQDVDIVAAGAAIPAGFRSEVDEPSVGNSGKDILYTGNWYAAFSNDGGGSFTYINPYADYADFCCDQVAIYDASRDAHYWLRQAVANGSGNNTFKLTVFYDLADSVSNCTYTFAPTDLNASWTNQWFDYPHMQMGADFLYIAFNVFDVNDSWQRTVLIRLPLDALGFCGALGSYNYYANSGWFTFVPVNGADHVMYFASNQPNVSPFNRIALWRWDEAVAGPSSVVRTVPAWGFNLGVCGSSTGNWAGRADTRLMSGVRYSIKGVAGRKYLAFFWNAPQGGSFPNPYVEAASFDEGTLNLAVGGANPRPNLWSSTTCFQYPSAAANDRGDVGLIFHYGTGANLDPSIGFAIGDDDSPPISSNTWVVNNAVTGGARPSAAARWGDYNTTRAFEPSRRVWIGASFVKPSAGAEVIPHYFVYGRGRDTWSFLRWQLK